MQIWLISQFKWRLLTVTIIMYGFGCFLCEFLHTHIHTVYTHSKVWRLFCLIVIIHCEWEPSLSIFFVLLVCSLPFLQPGQWVILKSWRGWVNLLFSLPLLKLFLAIGEKEKKRIWLWFWDYSRLVSTGNLLSSTGKFENFWVCIVGELSIRRPTTGVYFGCHTVKVFHLSSFLYNGMCTTYLCMKYTCSSPVQQSYMQFHPVPLWVLCQLFHIELLESLNFCVHKMISKILLQDYGIDFDDLEHPIEAFQCNCGSVACRGKRQKGRKGKQHYSLQKW